MTVVADVLNGAADLIERDGWVQSMPRGLRGERCINRATHEAAGFDFSLYWEARRFVVVVVGTECPSLWNDASGRTKAEVVAAIRAAAERAS